MFEQAVFLVNFKLNHFCIHPFEADDLFDLPATNEAENLIGSNEFFIDDGINTNVFGDDGVIHIFDQRNGLVNAQFFRHQTVDDVGFRVGRQGDKGIHALQTFFFEDIYIVGVGMNDQGVVQLFYKAAANGFIIHHHQYFIAFFDQLGYLKGQIGSANDHDPANVLELLARKTQGLVNVLVLCCDVEVVAALEAGLPARNDGLRPAQDGDPTKIKGGIGLINFVNGAVDQRRRTVHSEAHHRDFALLKADDICTRTLLEQLCHLLGSQQARREQIIDPKALKALQLSGFKILWIVDPSNGLDGTRLFGQNGHQQIGRFGGGHRNEQIGLVDPRFAQNFNGSAISFDGQNIEVGRHMGQNCFVDVNDGNVVVLFGEEFCQMEANATSAGNDNFHTNL